MSAEPRQDEWKPDPWRVQVVKVDSPDEPIPPEGGEGDGATHRRAEGVTCPAPDVPDEPSGSPSSSSDASPAVSPPSSDDKRSDLVEALIINTRAQLALVQAIRELIEYGTSQQEEAEEFPSLSLDGSPIRQS